ncbi:MAG: hypothetical protein EP330_25065 [Deltaproteobacteria bacterium]|nr:MAG: hypothetical protein EP330_25065 [Deltaproteobacteria bacterium]
MRPRHWVRRGRVAAEALLLFPALIGETEARRRVLALWTPGCRLERTGDAWLLHLPQPVEMRAETAVGTPLVRVEGALTEPPLDEDERVEGTPALWRIEAGAIAATQVDALVDPSTWLDLSAFASPTLSDLAPPPAPAAVIETPTLARHAFTGVQPEDPDVKALVEALAAREAREAALAPREPSWIERALARAEQAANTPGTAMSAATTLGDGLAGALGLREWLSRLLRGSAPAPRDGVDVNTTAPAPSGRGLLGNLLARLRMHRMIQGAYAKHFEDLLKRFEDGDFGEALRRAIPLGGQGGPGSTWDFGLPGARGDLTIGGRRGGSGGALPLGSGLYELLQQTYTSAVQRLERAERYEEAAFVLAELLEKPLEAIALLEKHELFELAAKIAEAKELDPELCVRLWFLAGDIERAVALAARHDVFAAVIAKLADRPEDADVLRQVYVQRLVRAGRFEAALAVVDGMQDPERLATRVLAMGIAAGGPDAAALRVLRLDRDPGNQPEDVPALRSLLTTPGEDSLDARLAVAERLHAAAAEPVAALARAAARTLLREVRDNPRVGTPLSGLVKRTEDPILAADLPTLPSPGPELAHGPRRAIDLHAPAGGVPVLDAFRRADATLLAAHGDQGARLCTRRGHTLAWFDEPISDLVCPDGRGPVIGIEVSRGDAPRRLWRMEEGSREWRLWGRLMLSRWAPDSDGSLWFVAERDRVLALDLHAPEPRAVWSVPVDQRVHRIEREAQWMSFFDGQEVFTYQLPGLRLRRRELVPEHTGLWPCGISFEATVSEAEELVLTVSSAAAYAQVRAGRTHMPRVSGDPLTTVIGRADADASPTGRLREGWLFVHGDRDDDAYLLSLDARPTLRAVLANTGTVRLQPPFLCSFDEDGRLAVLDLRDGAVWTRLALT